MYIYVGFFAGLDFLDIIIYCQKWFTCQNVLRELDDKFSMATTYLTLTSNLKLSMDIMNKPYQEYSKQREGQIKMMSSRIPSGGQTICLN